MSAITVGGEGAFSDSRKDHRGPDRLLFTIGRPSTPPPPLPSESPPPPSIEGQFWKKRKSGSERTPTAAQG